MYVAEINALKWRARVFTQPRPLADSGERLLSSIRITLSERAGTLDQWQVNVLSFNHTHPGI
jgi:hypothetical protein